MNESKQNEAIEKFLKNPYWKGIYDKASEAAKTYYKVLFAASLGAIEGDEKKESFKSAYKGLSQDDWAYVIGHAENKMAKWGLEQAKKKYSA